MAKKVQKTGKKTTAAARKNRKTRASKKTEFSSTSKDGKLRGADLVRKIASRAPNTQIADFRSGDTVNVYVKVKEGEKERVQLYKGTVTKVQGSGHGRSFTVRKISAGIGVERTFPFRSPSIDRVELVATGIVRRSKLYYLRELEGKAAKIESELAGVSSSDSTEG